MADKNDMLRMYPQMAVRAIASMLVVGAWAVFIIIYAFEWANQHTLFQNVAIMIGSLVVSVVAIGVMWMAYGMRHGFPPS